MPIGMRVILVYFYITAIANLFAFLSRQSAQAFGFSISFPFSLIVTTALLSMKLFYIVAINKRFGRVLFLTLIGMTILNIGISTIATRALSPIELASRYGVPLSEQLQHRIASDPEIASTAGTYFQGAILVAAIVSILIWTAIWIYIYKNRSYFRSSLKQRTKATL